MWVEVILSTFFVLFTQAASHQNHIPVEVETRLGKIRGQESIFLHKRVRSFLSVPFAEPPTGEQRFRPPKPKKPWNETITANTLSPACYQVHLKLRKL
ncbi:hypothetical protein COOONC_10519, partial [Cooperia oncophora]